MPEEANSWLALLNTTNMILGQGVAGPIEMKRVQIIARWLNVTPIDKHPLVTESMMYQFVRRGRKG